MHVCGMCVSIIGEMVLFSEYACISGKKGKDKKSLTLQVGNIPLICRWNL